MKPSKPKKEFKNSKPNCKSGEVKEGGKEYTIDFSIRKSNKPYWEVLGYKTQDDYYKSLIFMYIDVNGNYNIL